MNLLHLALAGAAVTVGVLATAGIFLFLRKWIRVARFAWHARSCFSCRLSASAGTVAFCCNDGRRMLGIP